MKRTPYIAGLLLLAAVGCVERRMTIISEPAGATAYLDGDELGQTPVTTSFLFYGGREIRLEMKGYETIRTIEHIKPPMYERFPIDLVSDVFIPWTITDRHFLPYKLRPAGPVDKAALVERANAFREEQKDYIAQERIEREAAEMERRRAELREREKQDTEKKKWYRVFY